MKIRGRLIALTMFIGFVLTSSAKAQNPQVKLTWTDISNPVGTTYNVYRVAGVCSSSAFSKVGSGVTVKNYSEAKPTNPGSYSYQVTAVSSGIESAPSNCITFVVGPNPPVLSGTMD